MVRAENKESVYKIYITDMLRYIVHNTAVYGVDGEGRYKIESRYADMIQTGKKKKPVKKPEKEQTSDEIIKRMKNAISKLK